MGWTLLRSGHVFDPEDRGTVDVLIWDERIAAIESDLPVPTGIGAGATVDVRDRIALPGLIDGHIHVMGASGMGGPTTRTTDLQVECIAGAGVTRNSCGSPGRDPHEPQSDPLAPGPGVRPGRGQH